MIALFQSQNLKNGLEMFASGCATLLVARFLVRSTHIVALIVGYMVVISGIVWMLRFAVDRLIGVI